jgi:hypothetical protein
MSDFIPKIGDLVVIQKGHSIWNGVGGMDAFIGTIHKYIGGSEQHCFAKPIGGGWYWRASAGHFRKPTEAEEIKYYSTLGTLPKVGDRVILKRDDGWNSFMIANYQNLRTTVEEVNSRNFIARNAGGWAYKGYELDTSILAPPPSPAEPKDGDRFDVAGYEGILKPCESGFFWYCIHRDNLIGFIEKNIRKKEFSIKILGYYDFGTEENRLSCRSIADLVRLLKAVNNYTPGSDPSVEFETSYGGYTLEAAIEIAGQDCTLQKDDAGDYPYYVSCDDSNDIFDPIREKLSIDRWEFQEKILGYKDPNEYSFPQCSSLRDLIKFITAIKEHHLSVKKEEDSRYGVGNSITIGGKYDAFEGEVRADCKGYEWYHSDWVASTIFKDWRITERDFQQQILGYQDSSSNDFPYCENYEDLEKFCRAIGLRNETESKSSLKEGSKCNILGFEASVFKALDGRYFLDLLGCGNTKPFLMIKEDGQSFQQKVLGYRQGGDFPECNSLEDLEKFIKAIEEQYKRISSSSSTLRVGDTYILTNIVGSIIYTGNLYYWKNNAGSNEAPFRIIGKRPADFQEEILGYRDSGGFPECKSLDDLQKFLNAIEACWNSTTLTQTSSEKTESVITPDSGISIIFINVPKI